jgi:hypothetical protein
MKPQTFFILTLSILPVFFACQSETSEVEAKRQELEAKRQELKDRKELAAVSEELKSIESEIKQVEGIKKAKTIASEAIAAGRITGTSVIMRQDASVGSAKLGNFNKGEQVAVLRKESVSATGLNQEPIAQIWYLIKRSNGAQGWVSGQFLKEI